MLLTSTLETELLDFMAEKFLRKGRSISYPLIAGIQALGVTSENQEEEIYFFLDPSKDMLRELPAGVKICIPVLNREEEIRLAQILAEADGKDISLYRLSLHDRTSFLGPQIGKSQTAV